MSGEDGFWEPVRSNVVDCFAQFFDYVIPRESLAVVRVVAYCLRERLAWCDADGAPRAPREVVRLAELDEQLDLDRKSIRSALERAVAARYLEAVRLPDDHGGGTGFRLKLDLTRFTLDEAQFDGFYPLPTHRIRVPLEFFTVVVADETLATLKVVACIIRLTLGSVDNLGRGDVVPAISQQQFVRRMNMGRRQAIQGVQTALLKNYIRRLQQGSLESGQPSTYGLFWRRGDQALAWPETVRDQVSVVPLEQALGKRDQGGLGKRDQGDGKKGSGRWEKGIREMGKGDQGDGKKGSGASVTTDLIKDLDLDLRRSSSSPTPTSFPLPPAAADSISEREGQGRGALDREALIARVRRRFPLGNLQLIGQHIDRHGELVGTILEQIDAADPAFLRRFTRSTDPRWAAFHTCCSQGMLPPRPPGRQEAKPPQLALPMAEDPGRWQRLSHPERVAELRGLWQKACGLYLASPPEPEAEREVTAAIVRRLEAGEPADAIEAWLFEEVAQRRGRRIGALGSDPQQNQNDGRRE